MHTYLILPIGYLHGETHIIHLQNHLFSPSVAILRQKAVFCEGRQKDGNLENL